MYKKFILISIVGFFTISCSNEEEIVNPGFSEYDLSVIEYFKKIALGFEFGSASKVTRRWKRDMKIFVGGEESPELLAELENIVRDINDLVTTGFAVEIVSDTLQSNYYIHFGSAGSYSELFPNLSELAASNWGLFYLFWDSSGRLYKGHMYVDIYRANSIEQRHLLREELTQSLGLARDSYLYPESIFQQSFSTKTTEYAQIDKDLIRLLYHPEMDVGLNDDEVDSILRNILSND